MNSTAGLMRTAIVSIAAAVDNVEAGHVSVAEREKLARVCDRVAGALRSDPDPPDSIDGEVVSVAIEY